ncbi:MAG: hypothetical protein JOY84_23270 [Curvibacter sp.]|nr:hypothetical protein [Curvibacter sp.]
MNRRMLRAGAPVLLALAGLGALGPAAAADPQGEVSQVGEGGRFLHYSTSQVRVELPPEDRSTYEQVRDQVLHQNTERSVWRACQKVLADLGYARVEADEDFQLIEADRTEKLVSVSREVLRGLLKARMGLPGKPDHQNTQVRVALQRGAAPGDWRVRVRFLRTVWDSNGDSRTRIVSDTEPYQDFFARLNQAL